MTEPRVKLASKVGDDLSCDVQVIINETAIEPAVERHTLPSEMHAGIATGQKDGLVPMLSEAVRALLIMHGCIAIYGGNHWVVRKERITPEQEEAIARATLQNRRRMRVQTGVPLNATFEDWRQAVLSFAPLV